MQSYPLVLSAAAPTAVFQADADLFVYESAMTAIGGDSHIIVKPESGSEIALKPGQRVRVAPSDRAKTWYVRSADGVTAITGTIVLGSGSFEDSNTSNLVTLSASSVLNSAALPVQKQALATLTQFAPVTINAGAAQALVSDATQRSLRIRNASLGANLYIGGAGVTVANAAIVLAPGGLWIEEEAPGAAWFATSDAAGTSVAIMGVKL
jgi:hypothetical protein